MPYVCLSFNIIYGFLDHNKRSLQTFSVRKKNVWVIFLYLMPLGQKEEKHGVRMVFIWSTGDLPRDIMLSFIKHTVLMSHCSFREVYGYLPQLPSDIGVYSRKT